MSHDISLLKHVLATLCRYDGRPTTERTIASDAQIAASDPGIPVDYVRDELLYLRDQGLAASRLNTLGQTVWVVTEKGKSAQIGL